MSGVSKITAEKNQRILLDLVSRPGNDACADCKSKAPRWASHNLGIFICVRCASIHRKIGTHVTKVKSLTLDSWSREQVENMKNIGNVKSNQYYNPDEKKHPPPTNMEESERDSELEKYIRAKYEHRRFVARDKPTPSERLESSSQSSKIAPPFRSKTAPIRGSSPVPSSSSYGHVPLPARREPTAVPSSLTTSSSQARISSTETSLNLSSFPSQISGLSLSSSGGLSSSSTISGGTRTSSLPALAPPPQIPPNQQASLTSSTFNDLISIQGTATSSTLPLQYQATASSLTPVPTFQPSASPFGTSMLAPTPTGYNTSTSPLGNPFANLSAAGAVPPFPSGHSPNFRAASMPIPSTFDNTYGSSLSTSPYNPFQPQSLGTPSFSPAGSSPNPYLQPTLTGMTSPFGGGLTLSQPQPLSAGQSQQPNGIGQTPSPFALAPPNFAPSPSFNSPLQSTPQQSYPLAQTQYRPPSSAGSPLSTQAQQAQQVFANMVKNPFK